MLTIGSCPKCHFENYQYLQELYKCSYYYYYYYYSGACHGVPTLIDGKRGRENLSYNYLPLKGSRQIDREDYLHFLARLESDTDV